MSKTIDVSPEAPSRLKRLFRKLGSARAVARQQGVNVRYVCDVLKTGRAPTNQAIGRRLFCEYKPPRALRFGDGRRKHVRWWKRLLPSQQDQLVDAAYHYHGKDSTCSDKS